MFSSVQTYFLKKRLNSSISSESVDFSGHKLGVLFNEDNSDKNQLQELIVKSFDVDASEINFLGFSRQTYDGEIKQDFVFTKKDFSLFGQPKSDVINDFLNCNYKFLFNFFGKNEHYLENVAQLTQAKLKVGLLESNEKINDLLLDLNSKDLNFFEESSKYIKHII